MRRFTIKTRKGLTSRFSSSSSTRLRTSVVQESYTDYVLNETAQKEDKIAVRYIENKITKELSFSLLKERVFDLSVQFYIRGWKKGEVILLFFPLDELFAISFLSATKIGITVIPVNPASSSEFILQILKKFEIAYVITTQKLAPILRESILMKGKFVKEIKEILTLDKPEQDNFKEKSFVSNEFKYNLLFVHPPSWGLLPPWKINDDDSIFIQYLPPHSASISNRMMCDLVRSTTNDQIINPNSNIISLEDDIFQFILLFSRNFRQGILGIDAKHENNE